MRRVLEYLCPILLPRDGGNSGVSGTAVDLDHMTLNDVVHSSIGDPQDVRQNIDRLDHNCVGGTQILFVLWTYKHIHINLIQSAKPE